MIIYSLKTISTGIHVYFYFATLRQPKSYYNTFPNINHAETTTNN